MIRILILLAALLVPLGANAQTYRIIPACDVANMVSVSQGSQQGFMDTNGDICVSGGGSGGGTVNQGTQAASATGSTWFFTPTSQAANPTSVSGTITSGGAAQPLVAAASAGVVRHVLIQNLSTDPLCFSKFTTTPVCGTNGTYTLNPATASTGVGSGSYSTPPGLNDSNAIYIIGATTGDKFTAETQ
jgi:hypothetical protein